MGVLIVFGFLGYVCKKIDFPVAPMAFTLILGPLTEKALRQALSMSGGDASDPHAELARHGVCWSPPV